MESVEPSQSSPTGRSVSSTDSAAFPLTAAQRGIWFAQHLMPDTPIVIANYAEINGPLDVDLLDDVVRAGMHEIDCGMLRLIEIDGTPYQIVDSSLSDRFERVDLRHEPDPVAAAQAWMVANYSAPIDLLHDRLIKGAVLRLADEHYYWYSCIHHIVIDGYGAILLINRTSDLYTAALEGREPNPPSVPPLTELNTAEDSYRASARFTKDRDYWMGKAAGLPDPLSLSSTAAAPDVCPRRIGGLLSPQLTAALDAAAERTQSFQTPILIAALAAYLSHLTGADDVVLSLPVSGRTSAVLRRSGGMVSNVVPIRVTISPTTTLAELVGQVQLDLTGALRHQRYRSEDLRRDLGGTGDPRGFYGPAINIMNFPSEVKLGPVSGRFQILSTGPVQDLSVNLYPSVDGTTRIDFEANRRSYTDVDLRNHHRRFIDLLQTFASAPPDSPVFGFDVLTAPERRSLVPAAGAPALEPVVLADILARGVATGRTAIVSGDLEISYRELDQTTNRLARRLITLGSAPGTVVAAAFPRGIHGLCALWAIAKTGATYLPLDPRLPTERLAHMLVDSGATIGLTDICAPLPQTVPWLEMDDIEFGGTGFDEVVHAESDAPITDADRGGRIRDQHIAYIIYTSGSTGVPKGVAIPHTGLATFTRQARPELAVTPSSRVLRVSSPSFDASIFEMVLAFSAGATLVIAPPDVVGGDELGEVIRRGAVTHIVCAPAILGTLDVAELESLETVVVGGDVCPPDLVARFGSRMRFFNSYGPTETTVVVTMSEALVAPESITIGSPLQGVRALVLDRWLRPMPEGVAGELYLAGAGLGSGYLGRSDLTAGRFVANPTAPGLRMYRTGDMVRWNGHGRLEYLGRSDFQVKIRGLRVELGEIESQLYRRSDVGAAVVVARKDRRDQTILVGYLSPAPGQTIEPAAVRMALAQALPAHMVPTVITVLEHLPLNRTGKVDRSALPEPELAPASPYRSPSTTNELVVASIFSEVLDTDRVGADAGFFELGGDSLTATRLVSRINAELGTRLTVRDIFEDPTVSGIARRPGSAGPTRTALVAGVRPERVPLSPPQTRMWFLNRFDPSTTAYHLPLVVGLDGDLDVEALHAAMRDVLQRHESLRTVFPEDDAGPVQRVLPIDQVSIDLTPRPLDAARLIPALGMLASTPFDITTSMSLRTQLFRLSDHNHVLALIMHHIVADGGSLAPLARDIAVAYEARRRGAAPGWSELAVQYADYAVWQNDWLGASDDPDATGSRQAKNWMHILSGAPAVLSLPTDRPRPAVVSYRGAAVGFAVDRDLTDRVRHFAASHDATMFMTLHAAYATLLARICSTPDIVIGTPISGRSDPLLDDLVGMFVNTVPLRTIIDPGTRFSELIGQVRATDLAAYANADVPFERLVDELSVPRSGAFSPVFQVTLSVQTNTVTTSDGAAALQLPGLTVRALDFEHGTTHFDLALNIDEQADGTLAGELRYATDLFDARTAQAMVSRFVRLLDKLTEQPEVAIGDVDILDAEETARLVPALGPASVAAATFGELISTAVRANPDGVALQWQGAAHTYREVDDWSTALAQHLTSHGAGPESYVAVAVHRSLDSVRATWAVIKTGAAFLPVDPAYPGERIAHMLTDSGARLGLTTAADRPHLPDTVHWIIVEDERGPTDVRCTDAAVDVDRAAYMIYTSGSTGTPKGVVVTHRGLANLAAERRSSYVMHEAARFLHNTSPSFDMAIGEQIAALSAAATLVISPPDLAPDDLTELLATEHITHALITPTMLAALDPAGLDDLVVLGVGGEAVTPELVDRWAPGRLMRNGYGPTEATDIATVARLEAGRPVSIGTAVHGVELFVLDPRLRPVPPGVTGELYLAGPALARGYHRRHALTAERFVANPFSVPGARMYRTGDVVSWVEGELRYHGRSDNQVKIRGHRIELGEIDAVLAVHPTVDVVRTTIRRLPGGDDGLVSYVVGATAEAAVLRTYAATRLPGHLRPAAIMVIASLPLSPNGKLDDRALPEPEMISTRAYRAPETERERLLTGMFAEILGVDEASVGADDSFFDLHGNSLSAIRVVSRVNSVTGSRLSVKTLFDHPDVASLARQIDDRGAARPALSRVARPVEAPLSAAQMRMWIVNQFDTTASTYNIVLPLRIIGDLDIAALQAAFADVTNRHESLRTVFPAERQAPVQRVVAAAGVDLTPVPTDPTRVLQAVFKLASSGFDVAREVPVRGRLLACGSDDHVVVLVLHHIVADGLSMAPLARDLMVAYTARCAGIAPGWEELPVQYIDFTLWQQRVLGSEDDPESPAALQIQYWRRQLADLPAVIDLPTDRPRPTIASHRGAAVGFEVSAVTVAGIESLMQRRGVSLFMVVHAALAALLARLSGSADVVIGTPVSGRDDADLEAMVGMFVNTLVLRTTVDADRTFYEFLDTVRSTDLAAYSHSDVSFERLVEVMNPPRTQSFSPLFQVMLNIDPALPTDVELPGLTISPVAFETHAAQFDLAFTIREPAAIAVPLEGELRYATDLFDAETATSLTERLVRVLDVIAATPSITLADLPLLTTAEALSFVPAQGSASAPPATLDELIGAAVTRNPNGTALVWRGAAHSYREVDAWSRNLARLLVDAGAGPETFVAIALPRSIDSVRSVWAVTRSGAAFVPVDPRYPAERITQMISDSGAALGITTRAERPHLPGTVRWFVLEDLGDLTKADDRRFEPVPARVDQPAYMIYTSGSTGRPKGVVVTHSGLANLSAERRENYLVESSSRFLHNTSPSFDMAIGEQISALSAAATLVISDPELSPQQLAELMAHDNVTHALITPSVLGTLSPGSLPNLAVLGVGGEAVSAELVAAWAPGRTMRNGYGPTEATDIATVASLEPGHPVAIGRAVHGFELCVLDQRLAPVPVGVPGELYLGGPALARGYHRRPDLTADRFVANPFGTHGERMYRTGDVVTWSRNGELRYHGRGDRQIKIRGHRVELGDIDTAVSRHPAVKRSVTVSRTTQSGDPVLVSYVVAAPDAEVEDGQISAFIAEFLPRHMVPAAVVAVEHLPVTPSGKLDEKALPAPEFTSSAPFTEPDTGTERLVADAFAMTLRTTTAIGALDDFFDLGGNSLLAIGMMDAIRRTTGRPAQLQWLFHDPTPRGLAGRIDAPGPEIADAATLDVVFPIRPEGERPPLFCIHPILGLAWSYAGLARHVDIDQPIIGIQVPGIISDEGLPDSIEATAARYVREIRRIQPHGPYHLLGWSLGGVIAHEMAVQLEQTGSPVAALVMLDSHAAVVDSTSTPLRAADLLGALGLDHIDSGALGEVTLDDAVALLDGIEDMPPGLTADQIRQLVAAARHNSALLHQHTPGIFGGQLLVVGADSVDGPGTNAAESWFPFVTGAITDCPVPFTHWQMCSHTALQTIGPMVNRYLRASNDAEPVAGEVS